MTSDFEEITYFGKKYLGRRIYVPTFGVILISTTDLNDALVAPDGLYSSEEAIFVDKQICFFVEPDKIHLNESQLMQLLINELDVEGLE